VIRLIEYQLHPGQDLGMVLRNSLVGTLEMAWGSLTGCIVDTLDPQQEDRLRVAKLQPGVWLANPEAMGRTREDPLRVPQPWMQLQTPHVGRSAFQESNLTPRTLAVRVAPVADWPVDEIKEPVMMPRQPTDLAAQQIAQIEVDGPILAYTLALALQAFAPTLDDEEFDGRTLCLSASECLDLARALLAQVPLAWIEAQSGEIPATRVAGDEQARESLGEEEQARRQALRDRLTQAARPEPIYREITEGEEETNG
jgi:hypothetical protein